MLHPALARALASAHNDDLHRAAALAHDPSRPSRRARATRGGHFNRHTATASESAAGTSCAPAAGMTPTETAQAARWPCQSIVDVPSGPRAGIDLASRSS